MDRDDGVLDEFAIASIDADRFHARGNGEDFLKTEDKGTKLEIIKVEVTIQVWVMTGSVPCLTDTIY